MQVHILTVTLSESVSLGRRLNPGFRLRDPNQPPEVRSLKQGRVLELRHPSGGVGRTRLVTFGVSVERDQDGNLLYQGDPRNPEIKLIVPGDCEVPAGTEVWLEVE